VSLGEGHDRTHLLFICSKKKTKGKALIPPALWDRS